MLKNKDSSHIFYSDMLHNIPKVSKGNGIYLYDTEGKKYLDGSSGPIACNIGHGVQEITDALIDQSKRVSFVFRTQFTNEPIERLAGMIANMTPSDLNRIFFLSSGSEASEMATKIARQYFLEEGKQKKELVISCWLSYHGITIGALSMSGYAVRRKNFTMSLLPYPKIPPPYCYRCPFDNKYPGCGIKCAYKLKETIQFTGPEYISAFIAEPVVGAAGGAINGPPEYFRIIREICDEFDILLIVDEVMSGFGRTGKNFAIEHWGIIPDIITFAKGASAGYYPLAGVIVSERIYDRLKSGSGSFSPGHTYSGTPLAGAVGSKVIKYYYDHDLLGNVNKLSGYFFDNLNNLYRLPIVGDVRGRGFFAGIEFVKNKKTKEPFDYSDFAHVSHMIVNNAFKNGLIIYPGGGTVDGHKGDHILVAPPLIINKNEIDELCSLVEFSISEVVRDLA